MRESLSQVRGRMPEYGKEITPTLHADNLAGNGGLLLNGG